MSYSETNTRPFWPSRWWWVALLIIVVGATALRYTGHDFSLPYIDHPNEPSHVIAAQMIIDTGSAKPIGEQGYPPGIVMLDYFLLRWLHDPSEHMSTIIGPVRFISVIFSIGTVVCIGLLGYRIGTPLGGLLSAFLWAVEPVIVDTSRLATPDSIHIFFTIFAFFSALTGALHDHNGWKTAGIFAIMLAIVFKYQALFVTPLILAVPLWQLLHKATNRQRVLANFGWNSLRLAAFLFWLLLLFPFFESGDAPGTFEGSPENLRLPELGAIARNIGLIFNYLQFPYLLGFGGLFLLLWPNFRRRIWLFGLVALLLGSGLWVLGMSFFGTPYPHQFLGMGALIFVLCGAGLAGWATVLEWGLGQLGWSVLRPIKAWIGGLIITCVVLIISKGPIVESVANAHEHTLPDRRNDLAVWADTTLAPAPYVGTSEFHKVFNGPWGGYTGQNEFPLVALSTITDRPIEEWRELGAVYAIEPYWHYLRMQETPQGQAYLAQMTVLKIYPSSDAYRDPGMVIFRLYPIQHPTEGSLGSINLIGYDIDQTEAAPGGSIAVVFYWQALQPTDAVYSVYNHLTPLDSRDIVAQVDGPPLPGERRPTTTWDDPDETFVSRPFIIAIGEDVPPGDYRLLTGFYQLDTSERLLGPDGKDYLVVTTITVTE